jgi:hypothetical protein
MSNSKWWLGKTEELKKDCPKDGIFLGVLECSKVRLTFPK